MDEHKKLESQQANIEDKNVNSIDGDQNVISGKVEKGGIAIQGGEHEIKIVQNFNTYATQGLQKSPDLNETIETEYFEPETILIPDGSFWMGSDTGPDYDKPRHEVKLRVYRISKYPVTNVQYSEFVSQTGKAVASTLGWSGRIVPDGLENEPVMGVTLEDARGYCKWLSGITKRKYDVPNEAQLEMAYQGPYGCSDLVDNIFLWTCTLWGEKGSSPKYRYPYPWEKDDGRNNPNANNQIRRVVCRYQKLDDASGSKRHSRKGEFPGEAGLPGARHSFRVVMNV